MKTRKSIAFIGLGRMGLPMAARLVAAGFLLKTHDKAPRARVPGATACASPADAVQGAGLVITMLPDGKAVRSVLLGRGGAAAALSRGAVVIDMSSSDPTGTRALGADLAKLGVRLMDAPVSGMVVGATNGTLTIMVGATPALFAKARPVLEAMGKAIYRAGPLGAGHAVKALNNYISAAGTIAAFEAVIVGRAFGLDPGVMTDIFNSSAGSNSATRNKIRQHVMTGAYASGFALSLMAKDVGIAADLARALGVKVPLNRKTRQLWRAAEAGLPAGADHTAIYRYLEAQAKGN